MTKHKEVKAVVTKVMRLAASTNGNPRFRFFCGYRNFSTEVDGACNWEVENDFRLSTVAMGDIRAYEIPVTLTLNKSGNIISWVKD